MAESKEAQIEQVEDVKRWTAKRKSTVVLDLIKGKTTPVDVARTHDLTWPRSRAGSIDSCRPLKSRCGRIPAISRPSGMPTYVTISSYFPLAL